MKDSARQVELVQDRFDGGMNMYEPGPRQFRDGRNFIIRDGKPTTRPGIRQYLNADGGYLAGYWFNEDNAQDNDPGHTGVWFDYQFVSSPWGGTIQGAALVRFSTSTENKIIFVTNGVVYQYEDGYLETVACGLLSSTETVEFVQANNEVYMFRSGSGAPLYWDGSSTGFVAVPDAAVGDNIPHADNGLFHEGRMWVSVGDIVYASAIYDFTEWDYTNRMWRVEAGEGEQGVILYPFHEDILLVFKKNRINAFMGVNSVIAAGSGLADYVYQDVVTPKSGGIAEHAIVTIGEDVWYLDRQRRGIFSTLRNAEGKMQIEPVAVSAPIQPYLDRVNWDQASDACAGVFENYILFAVPLDNSTDNNCVLVYDRIANEGRGAWCPPWSGIALNPVRFWNDEDKFIFLGADGRLREMFTSDPWDTEDPYNDAPAYDASVTYEPGDYFYYESGGDKIFKVTATCQGQTPPDTDYYEELSDQWAPFDIDMMIEMRQFQLAEMEPGMRFGRAEVLFEHNNPKVSLATLSSDYGTEEEQFSDQEYPRTEFDVVRDDWDETNADLDFHDPHRKDYALLVGSAGITADSAGLTGGIMEKHSLEFLPVTVNDRSIGLRVTNTRGILRLISAKILAAGNRVTTGA